MTRAEKINRQGYANGWHAQMLQCRSASAGQTMAEAFESSTHNSAAYNVPAECIKVTSKWIHYRFMDGSETRQPNQTGNI